MDIGTTLRVLTDCQFRFKKNDIIESQLDDSLKHYIVIKYHKIIVNVFGKLINELIVEEIDVNE